MRFVKFFHRYKVDGGTVLQDKECIIAAGSYVLLYYPETGEFLQIDEKLSTYPGAVIITANEYVGRMGFFRGLKLILKAFLGISHCGKRRYKEPGVLPLKTDETFEDFFENSEPPDRDLRPPVVVGGGYEV